MLEYHATTPRYRAPAAVEAALGRLPTQIERPAALKFALPIVLLPEMFTTRTHLAPLIGHLADSGWEVYAPDLRAAAGRGPTPPLGRIDFDGVLALAEEAIDALARDLVVMGHGIGGLAALALATHPRVRAAIALAPALPGFPTPLLLRPAALFALLGGAPLRPLRGKRLDAFLADADTFQRPGLARVMVRDSARIALNTARGRVRIARFADAAPRLIVAGDCDPFAPIARVTEFAGKIGARMARLPGRGHWLIGARAINRVIGEAERFLLCTLDPASLLA